MGTRNWLQAFIKRATPSRRRAVLAVEQLETRITPAYSASVTLTQAFFSGTAGASDTLTFTQENGLLKHNRHSAGDADFVSDFDFDTGDGGIETTFAADAANRVEVSTGDGNDTINIGTAAVAASTLLVFFDIDNIGADGDTLVVDDSANNISAQYTISSEFVTGPGIQIQRFGDAFNGGVELRTSSSDDFVFVESSPSSPAFVDPARIFTNDGDDKIIFENQSSTPDTLDQLLQPVTIDAGNGFLDQVRVFDRDDTDANTYTITATSLQRNTVAINFNNTVEFLLLETGSGNNSIIVDYSAGDLPRDVQLTGGAGTDAMTILGGPVAEVIHIFTAAAAGNFNVNAVTLVTYSGIESIDDQLSTLSRDFKYRVQNDVITVGAAAAPGLNQISGVSTSVLVTFNNPADHLNIELDSSTLNLNAMDASFDAHVHVIADSGNNNILLTGTTGTSEYVVDGGNNNDKLTIDYAANDIDLPITFNAGGGADSLVLRNHNASSITHRLLNGNIGRVDVDANPFITYFGLESIDDQLVANDRSFKFDDGNQAVTLSDGSGMAANTSQFSSAGVCATVDFRNAATLTIELDEIGAGNDALTIDLSGNNPIPTTGLIVDGGLGTDSMTLLGTDPGAGTVTPIGSDGGLISYSGFNINYARVESITDNIVASSLSISGTHGIDTVNIINGPAGTIQVNSGAAPTFVTINFSNKQNVTLTTQFSNDTVNVNFTAVPSGLQTLTVDGGAGVNTINVRAIPAITLNIASNFGTTHTTIGSTLNTFNDGTGSLAGILGTINVQYNSNLGDLYIDDSGDVTGRTFTETASASVPTFGGPGFQLASTALAHPVSWSATGFLRVQIAGGKGADTFNVNATVGGVVLTSNNFYGNAGNDIFNIVGNGLGANSATGVFGDAGNDTFNVTPALNGATRIININGGSPAVPALPGDTLKINKTGVVAPVQTANSFGNGAFTSLSHQKINFLSIESFGSPLTAAQVRVIYPATFIRLADGRTVATFTVVNLTSTKILGPITIRFPKLPVGVTFAKATSIAVLGAKQAAKITVVFNNPRNVYLGGLQFGYPAILVGG